MNIAMAYTKTDFLEDRINDLRQNLAGAERSIKADDFSEASYDLIMGFMLAADALFKNMASSKFQRNDDAFQSRLTAAAHISQSSTGQLLGQWEQAIRNLLSEDPYAAITRAGGCVEDFIGAFVPPDPDWQQDVELGEGSGDYENPRRAEKFREVITALRLMGIHGDDLKVSKGKLPRNAMRKWPYDLITIPRLGKQIAVSDQLGEVMLVSDTIQPLDYWVTTNKTQLKAQNHAIRYQGDWQGRLRATLLGEAVQQLDTTKYPKQLMPRAARGVTYSESILEQWIRWFHEKEKGKWPSTLDQTIWIKDEAASEGWRVLEGKNWDNVHADLRNGRNGMAGGSSLAQFKDAHGLNDNYTEDQLTQWIRWFHEQEGKWPSQKDTIIWFKDSENPDQFWELEGKEWHNVDDDLRKNRNGMHGESSLAQFKDAHGFNDTDKDAQLPSSIPYAPQVTVYNENILRQWILWFHKKEKGKWPSLQDKTIWIKDESAREGWRVLKNKTWKSINHDLTRGSNGLAGGSSLAQFKKEHGFVGIQPQRPEAANQAVPRKPDVA